MRNLVMLIIVAAGGYFAWKTWQEQPEWLVRMLPKSSSTVEEEGSATPSPEEGAPPVGNVPPTPRPGMANGRPTPVIPKFVSRIKTPAVTATGEPAKVTPGSYLVIDRASVETKDGVTAIVPGDQVRLLQRNDNGTLKVTNGQTEFVLKDSQVTQDIATAQAAERQDYEKRYGRIH